MITIIRLTTKEVLRKKIFLVVILLTVVFFLLYGLATHYAVEQFNRYSNSLYKLFIYPQLLSLGLYFSSFIVALLAVFSGVGAISGEIDSGILHAIATRPIRRSEIVLGKFLGYGSIVCIYAAFFFLGIVLLVKHMTGFNPGNILEAMGLYILGPMVLLALSLLGSTFLSTLANGVAMFTLYILAAVGGMVEQIGVGLKNSTLQNIGVVSSLIIPSDAMYKKMITVILTSPDNVVNVLSMTPFGSASSPSGAMVAYTVVYLAAVLAGAVAVFNRRDV
ncbi:hypothetical protein Desku_2722 [Desulfofundulus kuznetsovii DSM 6115]|uniref:ABC transporter permease n=1 Tax=Desulfofundulus kuznetsovii (strain DSM 6115 / VKM B-1805 / 17) TaxID=760568 RepID=A0AAU8Q4U8_DESK7|nr:hypothetical protein Desku_2722 [Desulfofundulus kuznetsovii DSM 6115]